MREKKREIVWCVLEEIIIKSKVFMNEREKEREIVWCVYVRNQGTNIGNLRYLSCGRLICKN